jgi:RHS repeat-associated protein
LGRLAWVGQKDDGGWCWALQVTTYDYDGLDNLNEVTRGNHVCESTYTTGTVVTTIDYDSLGRKTSMDDPDMGQWDYEYDVSGNLVRQEDANDNALCFYYDSHDRPVRKISLDSDADPCPSLSEAPSSGAYHLASYVYDTAANGLGMVAEINWGPNPDNNGDVFAYDSRGRAIGQTRTIDDRSFTMTTITFDALDRPLQVQYPDGTEIDLTYDQQGEDSLDVDSATLVSDIQYNSRGQITEIRRTGNLTTDYNYFPAGGSGGAGNGRLQKIQHGSRKDGLPDFSYTYFPAGNIDRIITSHSVTTDVQYFEYDHLGRMTSAMSPEGATPAYDEAYVFDLLGNIITKTVGISDIGYSYMPAQPHAVTSVGGDIYTYDDNGNMTDRVEGDTTYIQTFDVQNRLVQVWRDDSPVNTYFSYDSGESRTSASTLTHNESRTITYYPFPNYEEEFVQEWSESRGEGVSGEWITLATIQRSTYAIAGQTIAIEVSGDPEPGNNGVFYVYTDHLGSISVLSDLEGALVGDVVRYYPFGEYREPPTTEITDRGYTGHKHNEPVELIYMNARFYLGGIGRFASADTIVPDPLNPQQFNRYSYVYNNPVNYTDPTGHWECEFSDSCEFSTPSPSTTLPPVPVITLVFDAIGNFNPIATWEGLEDWDLLARMMLSEESYKILDPALQWDAVGAGWTVINRTRPGSDYDYPLDGHSRIFVTITAAGQYHGMIQVGNAAWAADPESYPTQFASNDAEAGRRAYWEAVRLAKGILKDSIPDPTDGRLIYADQLIDGTPRERTAFWRVQGSSRNDPNDPHLTIPQIRTYQLRQERFLVRMMRLESLLVDGDN